MMANWPLHQTRYKDEESSLTPIVHNKKDKAKEIVSYLLNLKSKESGEPAYVDSFGQQNSLQDIDEQESRDDSSVGVECVLEKHELSQQLSPSVAIRGIFPSATIDSSRGIFPASTSDSQRARECILPSSRQYKGKHRQNSSYLGPLPVDEASITSRWSHSSKVKPLFDSDMLSIVSKWSEAGTVDALFDVVENGGSKDDPWKAAKRGDLKALKKFHKKRKFDWSLEDQFYHTPLYYACHSGAIVNIDVVPFLLAVTPDTGGVLIEKCRDSAINKHVIDILDRAKLERTTAPYQDLIGSASMKKTKKHRKHSKNAKSGESTLTEAGSTMAVLHGYQNSVASPKSGHKSSSDESMSTSSLSRVSYTVELCVLVEVRFVCSVPLKRVFCALTLSSSKREYHLIQCCIVFEGRLEWERLKRNAPQTKLRKLSLHVDPKKRKRRIAATILCMNTLQTKRR